MLKASLTSLEFEFWPSNFIVTYLNHVYILFLCTFS